MTAMPLATMRADMHEALADTKFHVQRLVNLAVANGDAELLQLVLNVAEAEMLARVCAAAGLAPEEKAWAEAIISRYKLSRVVRRDA